NEELQVSNEICILMEYCSTHKPKQLVFAEPIQSHWTEDINFFDIVQVRYVFKVIF
ncbi:hypothetical protein HK096_000349, partial [Nowakowskiella sp. JEL0078]